MPLGYFLAAPSTEFLVGLFFDLQGVAGRCPNGFAVHAYRRSRFGGRRGYSWGRIAGRSPLDPRLHTIGADGDHSQK
jgi:hypothetical protein